MGSCLGSATVTQQEVRDLMMSLIVEQGTGGKALYSVPVETVVLRLELHSPSLARKRQREAD